MPWTRKLVEAEAPAVADERLALILTEVTRSLSQQISAIDALRSRAGTVVSAASLVSSFLGAATLQKSKLPLPSLISVGLAIAALSTVVVGTIIILWPYTWKTGFNAHIALTHYVETPPGSDIDEMRQSFSYYLQEDVEENRKKLNGLYKVFQMSVIAIGLEVILWLIALLLR